MSTIRRFRLLLVLAIAVLLVPATALANKQVYQGKLSTRAELHEVVNSNAWGTAELVARQDGIDFRVHVVDLSGAPTGVHLHGPATTSETAGILVTLCGAPSPAALATCTFDSATGEMIIQGKITSSLLAQWGISGQTLFSYLDAGLVYVNVHTEMNPQGEVRGQLYRR